MTIEEAIKTLKLVGCMNGTEIEESCDMAISALQKHKKLLADLELVCRGVDPCVCCKHCENRGDQFPCSYGEWCGGVRWEWRDEE